MALGKRGILVAVGNTMVSRIGSLSLGTVCLGSGLEKRREYTFTEAVPICLHIFLLLEQHPIKYFSEFKGTDHFQTCLDR